MNIKNDIEEHEIISFALSVFSFCAVIVLAQDMTEQAEKIKELQKEKVRLELRIKILERI